MSGDVQSGETALPIGEVICADCMDEEVGLPSLPDGCVDAVITDPPYGMQNNNDYARFTAGKRGHKGDHTRVYAPLHGDAEPFDPSPLLAFPRVVIWGFPYFAASVPVGTTLVWIKRLDPAFGSFLSDAEVAWMKGGKGVYCHRDTSLKDERQRVHPTQKPVALMRWCMDRAGVPEGGLVIDPFAGSGSTLVACVQTGRRFIGYEISPEYCEIARKRIAEAQAQPRLPLDTQPAAPPVTEAMPL